MTIDARRLFVAFFTIIATVAALLVAASAPAVAVGSSGMTVIQDDPGDGTTTFEGIDWRDGKLYGIGNSSGGRYLNEYDTSGGGLSPTRVSLGGLVPDDVAAAPDGSLYFLNDSDASIVHTASDGTNATTSFVSDGNVFGTRGSIEMSRDGSTLYWNAQGYQACSGYTCSIVYRASLPAAGPTDWTRIYGGVRCGNPNHPAGTVAAGACYWLNGRMALNGSHLEVIDNENYVSTLYLDQGLVSTITGDGSATARDNDGQPALNAPAPYPYGVAVDRLGNVFVATWAASQSTVIYKIDASDGIEHRIAGGGTQYPVTGGDAKSALFRVSDMTIDDDGNLFASVASSDADGNVHPQILEFSGVAAGITHPGAPQNVSAAGGDQSARVSFDAPSDDGGSPITGYTVTAHPSGAADSGNDVSVTSADTTVDVPGLTNGTAYDISVTATNAKGVGPAATTTVTPRTPAAHLTTDVTSGTAPLTVALDARGSTAPPGATFTFYCGDSDAPIAPPSTDEVAACTFQRGSPDGGWKAWVSMHDPATGRAYQDTAFVDVAPRPNTVDDSQAFDAGNADLDITVAPDGSLSSNTCPDTFADSYCTTLADANLVLTAAPCTFQKDSRVLVYTGNTSTLQAELGSHVQVHGGFAITWVSGGGGAADNCTVDDVAASGSSYDLTSMLAVSIQTGAAASPGTRRHAAAALDLSGFFGGLYQGVVSGAQRVVNTVGNALQAAGNAIGGWWESARQSLSRPNNSATNTVLECNGTVTAPAVPSPSDPVKCTGGFTAITGVPTDKIATISSAATVIAAGGGNVIAAGGGNVIAAGGGNVIAAGGGNFSPTEPAVLVVNGVIAAGGGNVIAAGGGNVIAAGGGNVIAAGGGNMTFALNHDPGVAFVEPTQTTPPTVSASAETAPPGSGVYASGPVTVDIDATPADGAAIQNVSYDTSGAQQSLHTVVAGAHTAVTISEPGITTITYSAQDDSLNEASAQTLTVKIAVPTTTALTPPAAATVGHQVTWTATVAPVPDGGTVAFTDPDTSAVLAGCDAVPVDATTGEADCAVTYASAAAHRVVADYSGHDVFQPSSGGPMSTDVGKNAQTITFPALGGHTYGDAGVAVAASASSGLDVALSAAPTEVCSIVAGAVHLKSAGDCTVSAQQDGNDTYAPADPVSRTFTIAPAALGITASDASMTYGGALPDVTPIYAGLVNGDPAPATPPTCTAHPDAGTTSCSGAADANYAISYTDGTLTVLPAAQTITFTVPRKARYGAKPVQVSAVASSGLPVTLSAQPASVCSVQHGSLVINGAGKCVVSGTQSGDAHYTAASGQRAVTVLTAPLHVTAMNVQMVRNGKLPAVGALYTGFVNGDSVAALAARATCHVIVKRKLTTCSGLKAADYRPSYGRGKLTVSRTGYAVVSAPVGYFQRGRRMHFAVAVDGADAPVIAVSGALPPGVRLAGNRAHTSARFVGKPKAAGTYPVKVTLKSGRRTVAKQVLQLVVFQP